MYSCRLVSELIYRLEFRGNDALLYYSSVTRIRGFLTSESKSWKEQPHHSRAFPEQATVRLGSGMYVCIVSHLFRGISYKHVHTYCIQTVVHTRPITACTVGYSMYCTCKTTSIGIGKVPPLRCGTCKATWKSCVV